MLIGSDYEWCYYLKKRGEVDSITKCLKSMKMSKKEEEDLKRAVFEVLEEEGILR